DNTISNNVVHQAGQEYADVAGIMVGFATNTLISHNDISEMPWSGIAIGWGWGLPPPRPPRGGLGGGARGMVEPQPPALPTPTTKQGTQILYNLIHEFGEVTWDVGAIYTTGFQGTAAHGELIAGNVAYNKRPRAGSNIFYTDGGSRYITLSQNVVFDNPQG